MPRPGVYDGVLGMYHDQVLIPIKTINFDGGVNVTLGLDFIRTSPDHGTAFDIAGTGKPIRQSYGSSANGPINGKHVVPQPDRHSTIAALRRFHRFANSLPRDMRARKSLGQNFRSI